MLTKIIKRIFCKKSVKNSDLRLGSYTSKLYIDCANLLLKNGFSQEGDYCFIKDYKGNPHGSEPKFFLYHFYSDGLTLNTYFSKQDFIVIKNTDDMQRQIDKINNLSANY